MTHLRVRPLAIAGAVLAAALLAAPAGAQQTTGAGATPGASAATGAASLGVDRLSADSLRAGARAWQPGDPPGRVLGTAADGRASYVVVRRTAAGEVEVHAQWDDLIVVNGGRGTLTLGRSVAGARATEPGETRGGTMAGPLTIPMRPGDLIRIPAGVPHLITPAGGAPLDYTAVKVRAPGR